MDLEITFMVLFFVTWIGFLIYERLCYIRYCREDRAIADVNELHKALRNAYLLKFDDYESLEQIKNAYSVADNLIDLIEQTLETKYIPDVMNRTTEKLKDLYSERKVRVIKEAE